MIAKDVKVYERKDLRSDGVEAVWSNIYAREGSFVVA